MNNTNKFLLLIQYIVNKLGSGLIEIVWRGSIYSASIWQILTIRIHGS